MKPSWIRIVVVLLALTIAAACSQNNGNQEQARLNPQKKMPSTMQTPTGAVTGQAPAAQNQTQAPPARNQTQAPAVHQQAEPAPAPQKQHKRMAMVNPRSGPVHSDPRPGQTNEISGTLVKTVQGVALFSGSGNFLVASPDLSRMVGKNVKVTCTIHESGGRSVITVSSVSVIQ